ncbi:hypothetical protein [Phytomonospora endophytica]|uniref:Uncharacterized protein n=1 Tax=Phytomonospora endophytica TaxID=714109 RepID=A0A841FAY8_9ACTN|nr:hypothetical protein [Phytomonospora endophytica]MBB6032934.1 hypothetical protein [Phytomonospora endophytica]GIG65160.1 hypothetical protein Pen01_14550 [Phytomonospora endophytica]
MIPSETRAELEAVRASGRYRSMIRYFRGFWLSFIIGVLLAVASLAYPQPHRPELSYAILAATILLLLLTALLGLVKGRPTNAFVTAAGGDARERSLRISLLREAIVRDLLKKAP